MHSNSFNTLVGKREYIAVDYFKFFCSLLVVTMHLYPFTSINNTLSMFVNNCFCRIAVPFFFLASGFFISNKITDKNNALAYLKRLIKLYLIYTIIYIPQKLITLHYSGEPFWPSVLLFVRKFFFYGSYVQLWYIAALIVSAALIYLFLNKLRLKPKTVLIITAVLHIVGILISTYREIFNSIPFIKTVIDLYYKIFFNIENGIFFGLFYTFAGVYIGMNKNSIKKRKYYLYALIGLAVMPVETYLTYTYLDNASMRVFFSTAVTSVLIFLAVAFTNIPKRYAHSGVYFRRLSALIYFWHMFISYYLNVVFEYFSIQFNSLITTIIVTLLTAAFSAVIISLSKHKKFAWLHNLY